MGMVRRDILHHRGESVTVGACDSDDGARPARLFLPGVCRQRPMARACIVIGYFDATTT